METELKKQLESVRIRAEAALAENLMPFWANHAWDPEYGGFLTRLDRAGRWLDTSEKVLMMQVRMIAALSSAHRFGLQDRGYLRLARKGFDFLINAMWDEKDGGFFFSVTREGRPNSTRKNTDVHAYVITGLVELYRASGHEDALEWAGRVFDVLMSKARDRNLGFIEDFDGGNWSVLNDDQMTLGGQQHIKTIDMHTNILEALIYLSRETRNSFHLHSLNDVLNLIARKGIDPAYGCTISAFDADWNPLPDGCGRMTTSYGLNAELAWLTLEAVDVLKLPRDRYRGLVLGLVNHALEFGFDRERGGLAANGPMTGSVIDAQELGEGRLLKSWWAQAELLNALIDVYEWTGEMKYVEAFLKLFDWVWKYQIDHEFGDWYQEVGWATGEPTTTDKGREFKTAFHAGRALARVSSALKRILGRVRDGDTSRRGVDLSEGHQ